jgi:hypothetical protein
VWLVLVFELLLEVVSWLGCVGASRDRYQKIRARQIREQQQRRRPYRPAINKS